MQTYLILIFSLFIFGVFPDEARADFWDDFMNVVHSKLINSADFIRDKVGPTIREKFDDAKESLQDPDTHEQVQSWVKEVKFLIFKLKCIYGKNICK